MKAEEKVLAAIRKIEAAEENSRDAQLRVVEARKESERRQAALASALSDARRVCHAVFGEGLKTIVCDGKVWKYAYDVEEPEKFGHLTMVAGTDGTLVIGDN